MDACTGPRERAAGGGRACRQGTWADIPGRRRGRKSLRLQRSSEKVSSRLGSPGDKACCWRGPLSSREGAYIRIPGAESNPGSVALGSESPHGKEPHPNC